jgi:hypothetical protein
MGFASSFRTSGLDRLFGHFTSEKRNGRARQVCLKQAIFTAARAAAEPLGVCQFFGRDG